MNKFKEILLKSKYELSVFSALMMNFLLFFTKDDMMSDILYPLHLVDVKIGLISRTLIGTVSGLLWKHPTEENIMFMQSSAVILTFFLISLYLGKCIKQADEKSGRNLFILSLIIAVFPYGFMTYLNLFELLDIYWVMSAALILLVSEHKKAAFLIPVFIFTGLWVHYSFVLAFMPLIYVLCINKCIKENSKNAYALTVLMIAVSVPATIYFVLTNRTFNVIPFEEFIDYIIEKAGSPITSIERYVGTGFRPYDEMNRLYNLVDMSEDSPTIFKALAGNLRMALHDTSLFAIICDFILVSPVMLFFEAIWKRAIKTAEDKKEKFVYFLCLISPLIQFVACFTSSDTSRWLSLMVISSLLMLSVFIKENAAPVCSAFNTLAQKGEKYKAVLIPILLFYLTLVFVW